MKQQKTGQKTSKAPPIFFSYSDQLAPKVGNFWVLAAKVASLWGLAGNVAQHIRQELLCCIKQHFRPFLLRGGIKKLCFFTFFQNPETPPLPPFLTTSVFSDKDFFDSAQTPPFSAKNGQKTTSFFI